jgi:hypothetical protein
MSLETKDLGIPIIMHDYITGQKELLQAIGTAAWVFLASAANVLVAEDLRCPSTLIQRSSVPMKSSSTIRPVLSSPISNVPCISASPYRTRTVPVVFARTGLWDGSQTKPRTRANVNLLLTLRSGLSTWSEKRHRRFKLFQGRV